MGTFSTIPAAKAALVALLQSDLGGVQVTWGWPAGEPPREWVMVGRVEGEQNTAAMGQRRREETYTIFTYVSVIRAGDQQTATERAFAIAADIETAVRGDVQLGGAVRTAEIGHPFTLDERPSGSSREAQLTVGVYCTARI